MRFTHIAAIAVPGHVLFRDEPAALQAHLAGNDNGNDTVEHHE